MHILFLFLDGIGLGDADPLVNPFAAAHLPTLTALTNGKRWLRDIGVQHSPRALFIPTDAQLGVAGRPQSGTSQAAILTGLNVPQLTGRHYGPKPDEATRALLSEGNFFMEVKARGQSAALLDAYPPSLLKSIARGKTLPSSIQGAALASGQALFTLEDLIARRALTPEWTGRAWHEHLKLTDAPIYTPYEAGRMLVDLSRGYDFAFHSHWLTDYVGHKGTLADGIALLEDFDGVIAGVLSAWDDAEGVVIVSSDHGNLEAIGDRHHTENAVPTLIIGDGKAHFTDHFHALTDFVPHMRHLLGWT